MLVLLIFMRFAVKKLFECLRTNDVAFFGAEVRVFEIEVELRCGKQVISGNSAYLHAGNVVLTLGQRTEARAIFERGIEICRRRGDGHAMSELEGALSSLVD